MLAEGQDTPQHRAVDSTVEGLRASIVGALTRARSQISEQEAVAMAMDPSIVLPLDLRSTMEDLLVPALARSHTAAARAVLEDLGVWKAEVADEEVVRNAGAFTLDPEAFAAPTPAAEAYAARAAARLVTNIDEGQRAAIRAIVERAIREGGNPREIAPVIRQVIGLNERQAVALLNRRTRLFERGSPPSRIASDTRAYTNRALRSRALNIARTEVLDAMNAGVQDGWDALERDGVIGEVSTRREWIATFDERTCRLCAPLDGMQVGLHESFDTGVDRPPRHPSCRCTMGLVTVETPSSGNDFSVFGL